MEARESIISFKEDSRIAAWSLDDLRPADVPATHPLELEDSNPIAHASRRLPPRHNRVVREELDKMLKTNIMTQLVSAVSFLVGIVSTKYRNPGFFLDYRTPKRRMKADSWSLSQIEGSFDDLERSPVFTMLDSFSEYWPVRIAGKCKEMTISI